MPCEAFFLPMGTNHLGFLGEKKKGKKEEKGKRKKERRGEENKETITNSSKKLKNHIMLHIRRRKTAQ